MDERPTHLDLFSGIGGFSLGFERAGFQTIGFSEIDPYASAVLKKHWPGVINYGDIKTIPTKSLRGRVDVLSGGFPCQPFSVAGKRRGTDDDRHLWPAMLRVISEVRPSWVVGENVVGIANMVLSGCLDELEDAGYLAAAFDISACAVGLPTLERHIWIVATRSDDGLEGFQEAMVSRSVGELVQRREIHPGFEGWSGIIDLPEPRLLRSRKGIPGYVDRIRCLGNAIDPRVAEVIAQALFQAIQAEETSGGETDKSVLAKEP